MTFVKSANLRKVQRLLMINYDIFSLYSLGCCPTLIVVLKLSGAVNTLRIGLLCSRFRPNKHDQLNLQYPFEAVFVILQKVLTRPSTLCLFCFSNYLLFTVYDLKSLLLFVTTKLVHVYLVCFDNE